MPKLLTESVLELTDEGSSLDIWMALNYTVHSSHPSGWDGMYKDSVEYCHACPQCVVVSRDQRLGNPPLQSIPVQ